MPMFPPSSKDKGETKAITRQGDKRYPTCCKERDVLVHSQHSHTSTGTTWLGPELAQSPIGKMFLIRRMIRMQQVSAVTSGVMMRQLQITDGW